MYAVKIDQFHFQKLKLCRPFLYCILPVVKAWNSTTKNVHVSFKEIYTVIRHFFIYWYVVDLSECM